MAIKEEIIFFDDNDNKVDKDIATKFILRREDENGNLIVVTDEETPYRYLPAYKDDNGNIVKEISTVLFNTDTRELYDTNK